jgi:dTDP-4-dehydrorhamnose 3,5-epimerase
LFKILGTEFSEVKLIKHELYFDNRGLFTELFNAKSMYEFFGSAVAQTNLSISNLGVIRGMHWQRQPFQQGKLVSCLSGSVFDVVLDIRKSSPNFGKHISFTLNSKEGFSIWIPPGFAHGFQALTPETNFLYFTSSGYSLENSRCINPLDPNLAIAWPTGTSIISGLDSKAPNLQEIPSSDLFE